MGNQNLEFLTVFAVLTVVSVGLLIYVFQLRHHRKKLTSKVLQKNRDLLDLERRLVAVNSAMEDEILLRIEQLQRSERLAFLGEHTTEIVHNVKNPLFAISSYAEIIAHNYPEQEYSDKIKVAVSRIDEMILSILSAFKPSGEQSAEKVDINHVIQSEIDFIKIDTFAKNEVQIELELSQLPCIGGMSVHWHQVIGNLLRNSMEALAEAEGEKKLFVKTVVRKSEVFIEICDTGCGMSNRAQENALKTSFTTKSSETGPSGSGIGLPFCERMVEAYGGRINFSSEEGVGTTFVVVVPVSSRKETEEKETNLKLVA